MAGRRGAGGVGTHLRVNIAGIDAEVCGGKRCSRSITCWPVRRGCWACLEYRRFLEDALPQLGHRKAVEPLAPRARVHPSDVRRPLIAPALPGRFRRHVRERSSRRLKKTVLGSCVVMRDHSGSPPASPPGTVTRTQGPYRRTCRLLLRRAVSPFPLWSGLIGDP